jgi:hypothetical protein
MTAASIDRRATSQEMLEIIKQIHDNQLALDAKLTHHMTNETDELAQAITRLMTDAFPEGDPSGHRRHHELVIRQAEARAVFWQKMVFEIARWGLIGFLGWAAYALWQQFLHGPAK